MKSTIKNNNSHKSNNNIIRKFKKSQNWWRILLQEKLRLLTREGSNTLWVVPTMPVTHTQASGMFFRQTLVVLLIPEVDHRTYGLPGLKTVGKDPLHTMHSTPCTSHHVVRQSQLEMGNYKSSFSWKWPPEKHAGPFPHSPGWVQSGLWISWQAQPLELESLLEKMYTILDSIELMVTPCMCIHIKIVSVSSVNHSGFLVLSSFPEVGLNCGSESLCRLNPLNSSPVALVLLPEASAIFCKEVANQKHKSRVKRYPCVRPSAPPPLSVCMRVSGCDVRSSEFPTKPVCLLKGTGIDDKVILFGDANPYKPLTRHLALKQSRGSNVPFYIWVQYRPPSNKPLVTETLLSFGKVHMLYVLQENVWKKMIFSISDIISEH